MPHPSCKRAGTPPWIRTRNIVFLRHARIPSSASGARKQKSPGTSRVQSRALETKKPGALARSGPGEASASALAVLRVRTRRVLAAQAAIHRNRFRMRSHHFLGSRGRAFCSSRVRKSTPFFQSGVTKKVGASASIAPAVRYNITPGARKRHLRCAIVHCSDDSRRAACFPACRIFPPASPPPVGSS